MWKEIKYWLDTHTMHPLAWPYVLMESAHHKLEDALAQNIPEDGITKKDNAYIIRDDEDLR
jgi:hypothetical protein